MQRKSYLIGILLIIITSKCFSYTYWEKKGQIDLLTYHVKLCSSIGHCSNYEANNLLNAMILGFCDSGPLVECVEVKLTNIKFDNGIYYSVCFFWQPTSEKGTVYVLANNSRFEHELVYEDEGISYSTLHKTYVTWCDVYLDMLDSGSR